MGCSQSKIENEEAVARCKERKRFMKECVVARNAFAAAHSAYAMSLKNAGAALSDYAQGEFLHSTAPVIPPSAAAVAATASSPSTSATAAAALIPETLVPPPPPPSLTEDFHPSPLQRAATMPEIKPRIGGGGIGINGTIIEEDGAVDDEEDDDDVEFENRERLVRKSRSRGGSARGRKTIEEETPPPPPMPQPQPPPQRQTQQPQPPPPQQQPYFEYFFPNVDNMPGTTLEDTSAPPPPPPLARQPSSPPPDAEETDPVVAERKSVDERPKRVEEATSGPSIELEKGGAAAASASGRMTKKGKSASVGGGEKRVVIRGTVNLLDVFEEIDNNFLNASESAHEVSKMLEATRLHYHSNFADNRGHIDHSARVMRVITWNRSFRGNLFANDTKDDFDVEENETHATVLDKLLAWEKKLYDEVKAGELMKFEYQRKVAHLNKLKNRSSNSDSLERAKASVSHLHTRYIVDMQSMDSTVSEINRLRDDQLYPKLVQLVDGMAKMWETMQFHHGRQAEISKALKSLDIAQAVKETSEHHHERTIQLLAVVQEWHTQFCRMIDHQKDYLKFLNCWLKPNLIPLESTLREKVSSPPRVPSPPILKLVLAWQDRLEKLPDEAARTAIINFAAVVSTITQQQEEEMKQRERCEETRKELSRKTRQFEDWYHKYMQKRTPDEIDPDGSEGNPHKDLVAERQFAVDQVKRRLEEEEEAYQRLCLQVREKSFASLRSRLPDLFQSMSEVAFSCSEMYRVLRSISQRQNKNPTQKPKPSQEGPHRVHRQKQEQEIASCEKLLL